MESTRQARTALSVKQLAALLLRLLGVYFVAWAIVIATNAASGTSLLSRAGFAHLSCTSEIAVWGRAIAALVTGLYFVVGGQWVFDRILTPIARKPVEAGRSPTSAASGSEPFCHHCGANVQAGQNPCPECGRELEWS
jgi:hypothetical protein